MNPVQPNTRSADSRLGELLLHVSKQCESDSKFGAVKLNKLLFFADFGYFLKTGRSVSHSKYTRQHQGPVPKRLVQVREKLFSQGRAAEQRVTRGAGYTQHRLVALEDPDLSIFTGDEIAQIDAIIAKFRAHNGTELSELSHELPAWKIAENGEEIPYEAAFLMDLPIDERDREIACRLTGE